MACYPEKIKWTDAATVAIAKAAVAVDDADAAAARMRQRWERGEIALFGNGAGTGFVAVEVVQLPSGERRGILHACQGADVLEMVAGIMRQAWPAGVVHWELAVSTPAHARLYEAWAGRLREQGVISSCRWESAVPARAPKQPTSEKIPSSQTLVLKATCSTSARPAETSRLSG